MTSLKKYSEEFLSQFKGQRLPKDYSESFYFENRKSKDKRLINVHKISKSISNSRNILKKIRILQKMDHDNIIQVKQSCFRDNFLFLETEYMEHSLQDVLQNHSRELTAAHVKYLFYQLTLGVCYLHAQGIEHFSICPKNVYISNQCDVKLAGFMKAKPTFLPNDVQINLSQQNYYTAPEMILNNGKNSHCLFKADIWSLGCIFFELLEKKHVFHFQKHYLDLLNCMFKLLGSPSLGESKWVRNQDAVKFLDKIGKYPQKLASGYLGKGNGCPLAKDLLEKMLKVDPEQRASAYEILQHEYFEEFYSEKDLMFYNVKLRKDDFIPCHPNYKDHDSIFETIIKATKS